MEKAMRRRRRALGRALLMTSGLVLAWPVLASPVEASEAPALLAGEITVDTPEALIQKGPDAVGGLGDWFLSNGVVCATISGLEHEGVLSPSGGSLVDLGHCGRGDDQWAVLHSLLNLSRDNVLEVQEIRAEVEEATARLVTSAQTGGLRVETLYSLAPAPSRVLRLETRVKRTGPGDALFLVGDVSLHGHRQLSPFVISALLPGTSVGFDHADASVTSPLAMADAMVRADLQVLVGTPGIAPGIAYGWRFIEAYVTRTDGVRDPVAHLAIHGEHFSILGTYADSLWLGAGEEPGLLELSQALLMDLDEGEEFVQLREIRLSDIADAASVTDTLWTEGVLVEGKTNRADLTLHVRRAEGSPVTFVRVGGAGLFSFRLPPGAAGDYVVEFGSQSGEQGIEAFTVPAGVSGVELPDLRLPEPGRVLLPKGIPTRLVFEGIGPTPDPVFGSDGTRFRVGGQYLPGSREVSSISLAGAEIDPLEAQLPAGRYRVVLTRGLEWSSDEVEIEVMEGEITAPVWPTLTKQVDLPGWVSADLHVHSGQSDDSALRSDERIRSFVAEGADIMVITEHDQLSDYQSLVLAAGLEAQVVAVPGIELTSSAQTERVPSTAGHVNAFPLVHDPSAYRAGAPPAENRRLRQLFTELAERPVPPVVQLNHPREATFDAGAGAFFTHLSQAGDGFDPALPLSHPQNSGLTETVRPGGLRDLDFHVLEVLNASSMSRYRMVRADWFSLLLQGEARTGTANSDSHRLGEIVALPRNYVAFETGPLPEFDEAAFLAAVRQGRLFGTTGPLLTARLGDKGPGEVFSGNSGTLEIRVAAADWVPVDELRVFVDGRLEAQQPVAAHQVVRIPLEFAADGFVVVEVEGRAESDSVYSSLAPGFTPFAFTNAILVDADQNGLWEPPGLVAPLPDTIVDPLRSP